jgi:hypothetical protein
MEPISYAVEGIRMRKNRQLATGWKRVNSYPLETMCAGMNLSAGVVKINDLYLSFFVDIIQFFVVFFSHGVQQV